MPIYEFRCQDCRRRTSVFARSISSPIDATCSSCGSKELVRLVSSFGIGKTTVGVHEASGEPGHFTSPDYYRDPRNIGRWAERRFAEMGMDIPSHVRGMIDAAREDEMPATVKDLQPNVKEI
ncbi:MAG: FmdB family zinc ribbon protein [Dehalococcoidia bacterium]|nr:hypothetical protein [Chloroflexota bacterium]MBT9159221.1 hypothetical protein [Chloroflexota bacterium]MBT9161669.1 hypothetical protein [Chloroflexota bacterium]